MTLETAGEWKSPARKDMTNTVIIVNSQGKRAVVKYKLYNPPRSIVYVKTKQLNMFEIQKKL